MPRAASGKPNTEVPLITPASTVPAFIKVDLTASVVPMAPVIFPAITKVAPGSDAGRPPLMASKVSVLPGEIVTFLPTPPRVVVAALTTDWMVAFCVTVTALLNVGPTPAAVAPAESSTRPPPLSRIPA